MKYTISFKNQREGGDGQVTVSYCKKKKRVVLKGDQAMKWIDENFLNQPDGPDDTGTNTDYEGPDKTED